MGGAGGGRGGGGVKAGERDALAEAAVRRPEGLLQRGGLPHDVQEPVGGRRRPRLARPPTGEGGGGLVRPRPRTRGRGGGGPGDALVSTMSVWAATSWRVAGRYFSTHGRAESSAMAAPDLARAGVLAADNFCWREFFFFFFRNCLGLIFHRSDRGKRPVPRSALVLDPALDSTSGPPQPPLPLPARPGAPQHPQNTLPAARQGGLVMEGEVEVVNKDLKVYKDHLDHKDHLDQ